MKFIALYTQHFWGTLPHGITVWWNPQTYRYEVLDRKEVILTSIHPPTLDSLLRGAGYKLQGTLNWTADVGMSTLGQPPLVSAAKYIPNARIADFDI